MVNHQIKQKSVPANIIKMIGVVNVKHFFEANTRCIRVNAVMQGFAEPGSPTHEVLRITHLNKAVLSFELEEIKYLWRGEDTRIFYLRIRSSYYLFETGSLDEAASTYSGIEGVIPTRCSVVRAWGSKYVTSDI